MRVFTPSPKSVPSGNTNPAAPPGFKIFIRSTRNRSAVSRVRNSDGKLASMPSSSMPPKGGLVTMTSLPAPLGSIPQRPSKRAGMPTLRANQYRAAAGSSCIVHGAGVSSRCPRSTSGSCVRPARFQPACADVRWCRSRSHRFHRAGSMAVSPSFGFTCSTMNW